MPVFTHSHLGFGNKQALAALSEQEAADCFAGGRATRIVGPGGAESVGGGLPRSGLQRVLGAGPAVGDWGPRRAAACSARGGGGASSRLQL